MHAPTPQFPHLPAVTKTALSTTTGWSLCFMLMGWLVACSDGTFSPGEDGWSQDDADVLGEEDAQEEFDLPGRFPDDLSLPFGGEVDHGVSKPAGPNFGPVCAANYPLLFGHRGVAWNFAGNPYPENTILSVKAALEMGAHGVEVDVTKTKDDVVVLAHENNLAYIKDGIPKTSCTGKITSSNYSDIKDCVVNSSTEDGYTAELNTLEDLLEMDGEFEVALDIKNDNLEIDSQKTVDAVIEAVSAAGAEHRFMLMLYQESSVRYALERVPRVCHKRHSMGDLTQAQVLENLEQMGATCLCINYALLDDDFLQGLFDIGVDVIPYALGEDKKVKELTDLMKSYSAYHVYALLTEYLAETLAFRNRCAQNR